MSPAREGGIPLERLLSGWVDIAAKPVREVRGLCHDSRGVRPGDLFFALAGSRSHGMKYAASAVASGACSILYDPTQGGAELASAEAGIGIPCIPVERLDQLMGFIADRFFGGPSNALRVVGVTGTNGKTSCSHFLAHALGDGTPSAVIGTLGWGVPGLLRPTAHTTPDAIEIHSLLAALLADGVANVAMEASSHGLHQGRLNGVRFKGGLFTNLSRDHLDYHESMEAYLEAKLRLIDWPGLEFLVFNLDDESAQAVLARVPARVRKIGFSVGVSHGQTLGLEILQALNIRQDRIGVSFDVRFGAENARVSAPLYGDFNVENLLGTVGVLLALGFSLEESARLMDRVSAVPGRMERFTAPSGATVVVDYAHTPDALQKALASLRRHCEGSLWVVFGCGGDRDRGKRPQMGAVAGKLADRVVLTDDNPRSEDGDAIIQEILEACDGRGIPVVRDRRSAIAYAVEHLKEDDVLLVAGKGHEDTQEIKGVKLPFSDRAVVLELLGLPEGGYAPCV